MSESQPRLYDKSVCAECGTAILWAYHHGAFQWTTDRQYAASTSYCYPFVDWESKHSPLILALESA